MMSDYFWKSSLLHKMFNYHYLSHRKLEQKIIIHKKETNVYIKKNHINISSAEKNMKLHVVIERNSQNVSC